MHTIGKELPRLSNIGTAFGIDRDLAEAIIEAWDEHAFSDQMFSHLNCHFQKKAQLDRNEGIPLGWRIFRICKPIPRQFRESTHHLQLKIHPPIWILLSRVPLRSSVASLSFRLYVVPCRAECSVRLHHSMLHWLSCLVTTVTQRHIIVFFEELLRAWSHRMAFRLFVFSFYFRIHFRTLSHISFTFFTPPSIAIFCLHFHSFVLLWVTWGWGLRRTFSSRYMAGRSHLLWKFYSSTLFHRNQSHKREHILDSRWE